MVTAIRLSHKYDHAALFVKLLQSLPIARRVKSSVYCVYKAFLSLASVNFSSLSPSLPSLLASLRYFYSSHILPFDLSLIPL